jgi:hypothetical protein
MTNEWRYERDLRALVGRSVRRALWDERSGEYLVFDMIGSPEPVIAYAVEGDCCSHSYFHDFIGVEKLLTNGAIRSTRALPTTEFESPSDVTRCYGYELVTRHPLWGEMTSVLSFRNESNGYYGGNLVRVDPAQVPMDRMTELRYDRVAG